MLALILAVLSVSVAVGMRTALPLLVISLTYTQKQELWSQVPILNNIDPRVILAMSISWSILELIFSKKLLGQRSLQIIQLLFSPIVGALVAIAVTHLAYRSYWCRCGASSYPSQSRLVFPPSRTANLGNGYGRFSLCWFNLFCL